MVLWLACCVSGPTGCEIKSAFPEGRRQRWHGKDENRGRAFRRIFQDGGSQYKSNNTKATKCSLLLFVEWVTMELTPNSWASTWTSKELVSGVQCKEVSKIKASRAQLLFFHENQCLLYGSYFYHCCLSPACKPQGHTLSSAFKPVCQVVTNVLPSCFAHLSFLSVPLLSP